jgi:lysophospholipase L1-like esterase
MSIQGRAFNPPRQEEIKAREGVDCALRGVGMVMVRKERRALRLFLPVVIFLIFSAQLSAADVAKIMPLGDSITRGWYGSAYRWGYREPLYVNLTNNSYSFEFVGSRFDGSFPDPNHEGHDGWRADEILNGRITDPCAGKLEYWLPASQPDIVLLHIGTNDITVGNQDANEVNSILNVIDAYEVTSGKNIPVVMARIIDRYPNSPATTTYNNDLNTMATTRIANGDNIIIVNMQYAINYSTDMSDSLHPNDNGYVKMANVWYNALTGILGVPRTLTASSTDGGSVTQPGEGALQYNSGTIVNLMATAELGYHFVNWTGTAVDAGRVVDPNSSQTKVTMDADYTVIANFAIGEENKLTEINHRLELRTSGGIVNFIDYYTANGWDLNTMEDLAVKIDFHYSNISQTDGWVGINVGDDANYVEISAGCDDNGPYFYYQAVVDGNVFYEQESRTSNNGTLYVSYNAATKDFYLSHIGFGGGNAHVWQTPNATRGQWSAPVYVSIGGGSAGVAINPGEAYLDNFEMAKADLLDWPPVTDLDNNGFIEIYDLAILCDEWLENGLADFDHSGSVDFQDLAEFGWAW